jgi:hypothetical protein
MQEFRLIRSRASSLSWATRALLLPGLFLVRSITLRIRSRVPKTDGPADLMSHVITTLTPAASDRLLASIDAVRALHHRTGAGMLMILPARVVAMMATTVVETLPATVVVEVAEATIVSAARLTVAIPKPRPTVVVRNGSDMMRVYPRVASKVRACLLITSCPN